MVTNRTEQMCVFKLPGRVLEAGVHLGLYIQVVRLIVWRDLPDPYEEVDENERTVWLEFAGM